ncbi:MAG TPA: SDR family oxidoreductase [Terriglobia bacterium]|nr:SDR family oxidoreductase [Terriglobia bacterium]
MPTVLILGATSSIGRAVASELARQRRGLVLTGRDLEEVKAIASDLALRYQVKTCAREFDILAFERHAADLAASFLAAGDDLEGAVLCVGYYGGAEKDPAEAKRVADTNFTGCVLALNIMAEHFEKRRRGYICALSSVAGDRGREKNYLYGATKAGLSAYLQGLRQRLFRANVRVITIKPGFVDTPMTYGRAGIFLVASPESVGKSIAKAIESGKDVAYVPWFWRPIMFAVRLIPERIFKRTSL